MSERFVDRAAVLASPAESWERADAVPVVVDSRGVLRDDPSVVKA
jgi:hypothetical protein